MGSDGGPGGETPWLRPPEAENTENTHLWVKEDGPCSGPWVTPSTVGEDLYWWIRVCRVGSD